MNGAHTQLHEHFLHNIEHCTHDTHDNNVEVDYRDDENEVRERMKKKKYNAVVRDTHTQTSRIDIQITVIEYIYIK